MVSAIHEEDIVIVGAGIAGLATALGLHRQGIRSLVLESSDELRVTGFALTTWTNAWRALDAIGIGDSLRGQYVQLQGFAASSRDPNLSSSSQTPEENLKPPLCEKKRLITRELPKGNIRYSSMIVSIEESGNFKLVHLADGSVFRTKVLIGCDGVNSIVAKWLGLQNPVNVGRSAIRGFVVYPEGHGFEPKFHVHFGRGARYGFVPCDDKSLYWFCTFTPSLFKYEENEHDPLKLKQFVLSIMDDAPKRISKVVERTEPDCISCAPLKIRLPWNILLGNIVKDNVCVAGDALHPMTPDIGQGGCSALEDSVVLARCLGEALSTEQTLSEKETDEKIKRGLEKYAMERRWRSFSLISTAYVVGLIQQSDSKMMSFLRNKFLLRYTINTFVRMADFDCGKLIVSSS